MLTFAYMSERISFVVPDGTTEKLKDKAEKQGHSQSALLRKIVADTLKECEHLMVPCMPDGKPITNGGYNGPYSAMCIKCNYKP